jgi:poly(hydroxyalkanoate) granule-associated protein
MKTAARKTAPKRTVPALNLPFAVPQPINEALKTASDKVDALAAETKAVAGRLDTNVRAAAADLKKRGEKIRKDPKAFVDEMVRDGKTLGKKLQKRAGDVRADLSKEATRIADDVTRRVTKKVDEAVEKTLHRFNVPTHQELKSLSTRVNALSKKIDGLTKSRTRTSR